MRLFQASQASLSASLRAALARSAAMRIELPKRGDPNFNRVIQYPESGYV
jgi:hypothetical protein